MWVIARATASLRRCSPSDFTANAGEFEHNQGFLDVFNGPETYDTARGLAHWSAPFDIVEPGITSREMPSAIQPSGPSCRASMPPPTPQRSFLPTSTSVPR